MSVCPGPKKKIDTFLVDRVRRNDWLPVGGDVRGSDHEHPSALSERDDECDRSSSSSDHDESSSLGWPLSWLIRGTG